MIARTAIVGLLLLSGCGQGGEKDAVHDRTAGLALERAALSAGIIPDPEHVDPTGTYSSDTDSVCLLLLEADTYRMGVSVDYGENQRCVARGIARGRDRLDVELSTGCRFTAVLDGDRLTFPASIPEACQRSCVGRASLTALGADRVGRTADEAAHARGADGELLCRG